jgi:hypothetical protein
MRGPGITWRPKRTRAPSIWIVGREPDWSQVRFGLACGYPDEHKKNVSANSVGQVTNQLITVVTELASMPGNGNRTITLNSALA